MLCYSEEVFREISYYLTWQRIPFRASKWGGIIHFTARILSDEDEYRYYVNVSENTIFLEAESPVKVPQAEKIRLRLLKFCNEVNRMDRMGGVLVLDPDSDKLLCRMTIPISYHRCGRVDQLVPVPAGMLNHYSGAIRRLIRGTSSVAREREQWDGYPQFWEVSPLISSGPPAPEKNPAEHSRRRQLQRLDRAIAEYMAENGEDG